MNDIEKQNSDINIQEETTTDIVKETNNNIVEDNNIPEESTPNEVLTNECEISPVDIPTVSARTQFRTDSGWVLGGSLLGRSHSINNSPCQDYHLYEDLGDGWNVFIVSDGAGSAKESHRGSKMSCSFMLKAIRKLVQKMPWKERQILPNNLEWYIEFSNLCRGIKSLMEEQIESLDEPVSIKDFNATMMVLVVSPMGMLVGHIGDGRMGYEDSNGNWQSLITPHKGEEANSTVFLMNKWDKPRIPSPKMSGKYIPETSVEPSCPTRIVLMTDGCENFSWECVAYDEEKEQYVDRNHPFEDFLNPLFEQLDKMEGDEQYNLFLSFLNSNSEACISEQDDRTMLICEYGLQRKDSLHTIEGQDVTAL